VGKAMNWYDYLGVAGFAIQAWIVIRFALRKMW
jgi:hypothetical protein